MRQIQSLFKFVSIGLAVALLTGSTAQAQKTGDELFAVCAACHTVGEGTRVGPDLAGVANRRSEEWLIRFIQDSQAVVKSGDADAVALFEEFNKLVMPPNVVSDDEVRILIAHIAELEANIGVKAPTPIDTATAEQIENGRALFSGEVRFANRGASCQSCHQVTDVGIMGGGSLAKDLTRSAGRIGGSGVLATVKAPSYPLMAQAYADKPLTDEEVFDLVAFLEKTDQDNVAEGSGLAGIGFLFAGLIGCAVLIAIYSLIWNGRKRGCVYDEIHARQLGTE